jgi:peptidoglycan pentaglycine glycine transferase (the first glycine)
MEVVICDNSWKNKWDEFVKANSSDFGLLQSWAWGEFQRSLARKVFNLVVVDGDKILAAAGVIKMPLRLGKSYFYVPRGPIAGDNDQTLRLLLTEIGKLAEKEGVIFTRFEPVGYEVLCEFKNIGQVQPKTTLILDLDITEDELLAQMKSKTRYNIKVAKKRGVEIDEGNKYFDDFWRLTGKTSSRQEIKPHSEKYYRKMVDSLGDSIKIKAAKVDGKVVVANLVIYIGEWCVYLHGASDYEYRSSMAPFLLQWKTILDAKEAGLKYYDFWGVDEKKWPGVTRFKKGFAPKKDFTVYLGAYDIVYRKLWYNMYNIIRKSK